MKKCKGPCGLSKSLTEFFKDKALKDGHANTCKDCKTQKTLQWRADNKDHYNERARFYNKKHYAKLRLNRYDLSLEDYNKMLKEQNNICAIPGCGKGPTEKRKLAVDHCHSTGSVRGLLCYGCNRDMALVDKPDKLAHLLAYKAKNTKGVA